MNALFCTVAAPLVFLTLTACSQSSSADRAISDSSAYVQLAPQTFEAKLTTLTDEQLIDVRTLTEYEGGHLPNAVLMDFRGEHFEQDIARLDRDRPVMVYCAKGGRSTATAARLQAMGFREIYELEGGVSSWLKAGKAVTP